MSAPGSVAVSGPTADIAVATAAELATMAPALVSAFWDLLPAATDVVARRVAGAALREGLGGLHRIGPGDHADITMAAGASMPVRVDRHGFGRTEVAQRLVVDPATLVRRIVGAQPGIELVMAEVSNAAVNLALAYARRPRIESELMRLAAAEHEVDAIGAVAGLDSDHQGWTLERLGTDGHNLHPCGRTRLGWSVADVLAHDLETTGTWVGFVGVRRDLLVGPALGVPAEADGLDPRHYAVTPVHGWQLERVVRTRYADLIADGRLVPLDLRMTARPTAALRTVLVDGRAGYLKLSLDVQISSTRRSISVASTHNGPVLSALLAQLLAADPAGQRVLLMTEEVGSAVVTSDGRSRDLSAIVRRGLSGHLAAGEVAVPGGALAARSPVSGTTVVAELVARFGATRGLSGGAAAHAFLADYARLLLPPVLTLVTRHGIGFEAHLQNCVPTFVGGVPNRLALRDLGGLRLFPPRLDLTTIRPGGLDLWPGSVIVTDDVDVMRAKVAYTALQSHLGEVILQLAATSGLDEPRAWATVRDVIDGVYGELMRDPAVAERARADYAYLTGPTLPHKALLTMRLAAGRGEGGDIYVPVANPLR